MRHSNLIPLLAMFLSACESSVELAPSDPNELPPPPVSFRSSSDPTSLGQVSELVGDLLVDDQRIYWEGSDGVASERWLRSCEKQNCARTVVSYARSAGSFAVESGKVFWLGQADFPGCTVVLSCDVGGCDGAPREVGRPSVNNCSFATSYDADFAYVCGIEMLQKIPLSGVGEPVQLASPNDCSAVAVRDGFVYWLDTREPLSNLLALRRTSIDGSSGPELLADNLRVLNSGATYPAGDYPVQNLTVDSSFVYWSQGSLSGAIARCPLTGCVGDPAIITQSVRSPKGIVLDGDTLYFQNQTSDGAWAISRVPLAEGATAETLVKDVATMSALAVDDRYLYTATTEQTPNSDGTWSNPWASIRRISKVAE